VELYHDSDYSAAVCDSTMGQQLSIGENRNGSRFPMSCIKKLGFIFFLLPCLVTQNQYSEVFAVVLLISQSRSDIVL
jgi:hypothetical protein